MQGRSLIKADLAHSLSRPGEYRRRWRVSGQVKELAFPNKCPIARRVATHPSGRATAKLILHPGDDVEAHLIEQIEHVERHPVFAD